MATVKGSRLLRATIQIALAARSPRRSLASQSEAGQQIRPSGSAAGTVPVAPLSRRERARHPRPQTR